MKERYARLYSQNAMLYTESSPIVVSAGTLLSDSLTGKVLVQLKLKNISEKEVSSLTADILPLNAEGEEKYNAVKYEYTDLHACRDDSFGSNIAVVMPDTAVRSYKVRIALVCFADGSIWEGREEYFSPLPAPRRLEAALDDEELSRQFRISYGEDCNYMSSEEGDLWFCTCGAINHADEPKCHRCRRVHSALKNINLASLRSETSKRVTAEKKQEEEESIENSEKRGKLIKLLAILVPAVLIIAVLLATLPGYFIRKNNYAKAVSLLDAGEYDYAQQAFEALGDYEDSRELAEKEIPYRRAAYIMSCAEKGDTDALVMLGMKRSELGEEETVSTALYHRAAEMFAALGDYRDSAAQSAAAEKAVSDYYESLLSDSYDSAAALLKENRFCEARDAFAALGDYKDSQSMVTECIYRKAELLFGLTEKYSMEGISCSLSTVTGEKSVFYIPQEIYVKLGSGISTDIREICAADGVEINYEAPPAEGTLPFCDAVSSLYGSLGDYKDSTARVDSATDAGDYTKPFYTFIEEGKLAEALAWLNEFDGDFAERDRWASFISIYLPFCGTWQFDSGDPTLVPRTLGVNAPCSSIATAVLLSENGGAVLRIYIEGNTNYSIELQPSIKEDGTVSFSYSPDGVTSFYLIINNAGKISYSQHNSNIPTNEILCSVFAKTA